RQDALQGRNAVDRVGDGVNNLAGHVVRLVAGALVCEEAEVARPFRVVFEVETGAERILAHGFRRLDLRCVAIRSRSRLRGADRRRRQESGPQLRDEWRGTRPRKSAGHRLDDVDAGVKLVAFVTAEEEGAVLDDGAANRSTKLILLEQRLRQLALNRPVRVA